MPWSFGNFTLCQRPRWSDNATTALIVVPGVPIGQSTMTSQLAFETALGMIGNSNP
jgi:hypothetical protein